MSNKELVKRFKAMDELLDKYIAKYIRLWCAVRFFKKNQNTPKRGVALRRLWKVMGK